MILADLINQISVNPVFAGLTGAALIGGILFWLRKVPQFIYFIFTYHFTVRFSVKEGDMAFEWMDKWLSLHPSSAKSNSLKLRTNDIGEEAASWMLTAGYGTRLIWVENHPFLVNRSIMEAKPGGLSTNQPEQITLSTIGFDQKRLRDLVKTAHKEATHKNQVQIRVWLDWWAPVIGKEPRSLESIVLAHGQMDRVVADIEWFLHAKSWYQERGIPYRRGYMFSGPPGTGKTSIVLALANHFKRSVCMLNLGSIKNDESLFRALLDAPINSIILIEDIDCAQSSANREISKIEGQPSINNTPMTTAGLLNALDGVLTPDGRIIIMTTNRPESLDSALIRPGRADIHERFEYLQGDDQVKLAAKFYSEIFESIDKPIAPAVMQSVFMKHVDSLHAARNELIESHS
jgi:chaperone BCS1